MMREAIIHRFRSSETQIMVLVNNILNFCGEILARRWEGETVPRSVWYRDLRRIIALSRALQGAIRRALVFEVKTYADDIVVRVPFQGKGKMRAVFRDGVPQPNHYKFKLSSISLNFKINSVVT